MMSTQMMQYSNGVRPIMQNLHNANDLIEPRSYRIANVNCFSN